MPPSLPPHIDWGEPELTKALIGARTVLAELKGYSISLPNPFLLLSPAILKEAIASSEIENIHTTMLSVLQSQLLPEAERTEPDKEVLRYNEAIRWGFDQLKKHSVYSDEMIQGIAAILMQHDSPGYRIQQNAIINGLTGDVLYLPPPANKVPDLLHDIQKFAYDKENGIDDLLKCSLIHYQFESIHPFGDGNGRTGRILMILHLVETGMLHFPILFISQYINSLRPDYYNSLQGITKDNDWMSFLLFLLEGFREQAADTKKQLFEVMMLLESVKKHLKDKHRKFSSTELAEALFTHPIISPVKLGELLSVHYTTASRYLKELEQSGIITSSKHGKYHLYANNKLLNLLTPSTS